MVVQPACKLDVVLVGPVARKPDTELVAAYKSDLKLVEPGASKPDTELVGPGDCEPDTVLVGHGARNMTSTCRSTHIGAR